MKATSSTWKLALQRGLLGGLVAAIISLIGLIQAFNTRDLIGGLLPLGLAFLLTTFFAMSYIAIRKINPVSLKEGLIAGAILGAASGLVLALMVILFSTVDLRSMFINASPELFEILTFGQPLLIGVLLLILVNILVSEVTVAIYLLPEKARRMTMQTLVWVGLIGLLADLLRIISTQWGFIGVGLEWMFAGRGLSLIGTIVVTAIVVGLQVWQDRQPPRPRQKLNLRPKTPKDWAILIVIVVVMLALPWVMGTYISEVFDQVGIFILMGLGLNIVVGFAGLLDLGYVAFYAIGAYTVGVLTSPELASTPLSWWLAAPIAVLVATLSGALLGIPVLRMRGDYLAIVTLGFGEIIRILALSDLLKPYIGGSQGIQLIGKPSVFGFVLVDQRSIYYVILGGVLLAAFIAIRLRDSRMGRTWMALREDEDVAQAQGINLVATKLLAFATGAAFSGLGGAIFAAKLGSAYPQSFQLMVSINVLALIIVGGMGSIPGVIVGGLVLVGLPELLREFAEFRQLVYGAVLVAMMLYRPEGLVPEQAHRRELHADQVEAASAEEQA